MGDYEICAITGNRCGTDTWVQGDCCRCDNCVRFMVRQANEAVRMVAEVARERDQALKREGEARAEGAKALRLLAHFNLTYWLTQPEEYPAVPTAEAAKEPTR